MPDLLTWLNAEHLAAQQAYQAKRDPYREGMVDALDRVIARVEKQTDSAELAQAKARIAELEGQLIDMHTERDAARSQVDLTKHSIRQWAQRWFMQTATTPRNEHELDHARRMERRACAGELTRALDALEAGR